MQDCPGGLNIKKGTIISLFWDINKGSLCWKKDDDKTLIEIKECVDLRNGTQWIPFISFSAKGDIFQILSSPK